MERRGSIMMRLLVAVVAPVPMTQLAQAAKRSPVLRNIKWTPMLSPRGLVRKVIYPAA
jgi:hypothetical protein